MTVSIMTVSIMTLSIMTLSIMTLSIMTLSIMALSIMRIVMLIVVYSDLSLLLSVTYKIFLLNVVAPDSVRLAFPGFSWS